MKILLSHGYFLADDLREQQIMRPYPPLGLQYISAYLSDNQFDNEVFDTTFSTLEALQKRILSTRPRLLGLYINLMTRVNILKIIQFVKSKKSLEHTVIVLGGPETRYHRDDLLVAGADILVLGEGEHVMLEIAQNLKHGNPKNLEHVAGIAVQVGNNGEILETRERPMIVDLDNLPFPARDKIDYQAYFDVWSRHHGTRMLTINTMRGCPYGCKWCSRAVYGKSYRRRSPKGVVDEIQELQDSYGFDSIWFVDDVFTINPSWMREFTEELENPRRGDLIRSHHKSGSNE